MSQEQNEDEMTPEQRLEWLRERGVHVETPQDRKIRQPSSSVSGSADDGKEEPTEISFVCVPADSSMSMEERTVLLPHGHRGDYLSDHLRKEFSAGSEKVDVSLLQQQAQQTLAASPDTPTAVSDATLRQVAQSASVETFALVHPTPSNQFTSIQIYLDEVGMLKRLPLNARAMTYAERAGFVPPPQFYGDVFLGRIQKKPAIVNQSFRLGVDTATDAPWLSRATMENLEYQTAMNEMTGRKDARQAAVAGSEGQVQQEDSFQWTQTEEEIEITISLATTTATKSKDVQVKFRPRHFSVQIAQLPKVTETRLFEHVDVDGCTWTIDRDANTLVITMEKADAALWPRLID